MTCTAAVEAGLQGDVEVKAAELAGGEELAAALVVDVAERRQPSAEFVDACGTGFRL